MSVKFISDLHFCHNNIIPYTIEATNEWRKNGYSVIEPLEKISSIEAYDAYIINEWNKNVKDDDEIYLHTESGGQDLEDEWSENNPQQVNVNDMIFYLDDEFDIEYALRMINDYGA